ncbi:Elongator complex protein 2 [Elsinoe australis]|uniref:Elongator complex protein 2 n=1 Tax=Elsinoe australis TaxID=40998 RepID=A0A2P7YGC8_9PEZI|nr:Elongator complex protein 2 [Elsinoe australis]
MSIHLVCKTLPTKHHLVPLPPSHHSITPSTSTTPSTSLPPSTLRLTPTLLALASNNKTYHALGSLYCWWSTYPVPASLNPSSTPSIPSRRKHNSSRLGLRHRLRIHRARHPPRRRSLRVLAPLLRALGPDARSPPRSGDGRKGLMGLYNRYLVVHDSTASDEVDLSGKQADLRASVRPVWEMGLLLRYTFPVGGEGAVYPLGMGTEWEREDADLGKAVVVVLGARSKTGRSVAWGLTGRGNGIKGLVLGASRVERLEGIYGGKGAEVVRYEDVDGRTVETVKRTGAERVVLFDCGSPPVGPGVVETAQGLVKTTVVVVGSGPALYAGFSDEEVTKVQFSVSGARDDVMKKIGSGEYFEAAEKAWDDYVADEGETWEIERRKGVREIKRAWEQLVNGLEAGAVVIELP